MTLPEGAKTATETNNDLRGTFCGNQGNRLTKSMLSRVSYSLKNKFNLFSVMNLLMNGWDLGGDGNEILIRNKEQIINFDINNKTKEVIMFAVYVD